MLERYRRPHIAPVLSDLAKDGWAVSPVDKNLVQPGCQAWDVDVRNGPLDYTFRATESPGVVELKTVVAKLRDDPTPEFRTSLTAACSDIRFASIDLHGNQDITVSRAILTNHRGTDELHDEVGVFNAAVVETYKTVTDLCGKPNAPRLF